MGVRGGTSVRPECAAVAHEVNAYADRLDELAEDLDAGEW